MHSDISIQSKYSMKITSHTTWQHLIYSHAHFMQAYYSGFRKLFSHSIWIHLESLLQNSKQFPFLCLSLLMFVFRLSLSRSHRSIHATNNLSYFLPSILIKLVTIHYSQPGPHWIWISDLRTMAQTLRARAKAKAILVCPCILLMFPLYMD